MQLNWIPLQRHHPKWLLLCNRYWFCLYFMIQWNVEMIRLSSCVGMNFLFVVNKQWNTSTTYETYTLCIPSKSFTPMISRVSNTLALEALGITPTMIQRTFSDNKSSLFLKVYCARNSSDMVSIHQIRVYKALYKLIKNSLFRNFLNRMIPLMILLATLQEVYMVQPI